MPFTACFQCNQQQPSQGTWFVCSGCGFRVCSPCLHQHQGPYGFGFKCSRCATGQMKHRVG